MRANLEKSRVFRMMNRFCVPSKNSDERGIGQCYDKVESKKTSVGDAMLEASEPACAWYW